MGLSPLGRRPALDRKTNGVCIPGTLPTATSPVPTTSEGAPTATATSDPDALGRLVVNKQGSVAGRIEELRLRVELAQSLRYESATSRLWVFEVLLGKSSHGARLAVDSGPTFDAAAGFLTDGANGYVIINLISDKGGAETGYPESLVFFGRPPGSPGPVDLAGAQIRSLELILDQTTIGEEQAGSPLDFAIHGYFAVKGEPPS
jgi:hypothetical protein